MHLRRQLATTVAAVLVTMPLVSSCGFNLGTDRVNTNTAGTQNRTGTVDVLAAVVVAAQPGAGTFIATLSNKSDTDDVSFESVEGAEGTSVTPADFEPLSIAPRGFANLADGGGVRLTGQFEAGDVIPLTIGFSDGETVEIDVPVVTACEEYLGLDPSGSASASPSGTATTRPSQTPSIGEPDSASPGGEPASQSATVAPGEDNETVTPSSTPTASASASPEEEASASGSAYSCEYAPSTE